MDSKPFDEELNIYVDGIFSTDTKVGGKILVYKVLKIEKDYGDYDHYNVWYKILESNNQHYEVGDTDSWYDHAECFNDDLDLTEIYDTPMAKALGF